MLDDLVGRKDLSKVSSILNSFSLVIVFLHFDCSEIDEIFHLQNMNKGVLVSSPYRVIRGVNYRLGLFWDVPGGNKRAGCQPAG
jgi:hypothetical protein